MKVLLCTDRWHPAISGVITSVQTLKTNLERLGHEVKVLTLSEKFGSRATRDEVFIGSVNADSIYPDIRISHPVSRQQIEGLVKWQPDIIHCNTEFCTYWLAQKIQTAVSCPMVLTYHTDYEDYVHYIALSKKFGKKVVKGYMHHISGHMTRIICPTQKTRDRLIEYGVKAPLVVIPTGLELEPLTAEPSEETMNALREKHGLRPDTTTFVYVGRIGKEKNIDELLELLSQRKDSFQFLIVGGGPDEGEIREKIQALGLSGKAVMAGMVPHDQVGPYYHLGDIFMSASTSETQGLTYIEAMAAGTPLLCRRDKCLDGVLDDGVEGMVFSDGDEFTRKLDQMLSDKAKLREMGSLAQARTVSKFGGAKFASDMTLLYKEAIRDYRPYKRSPLSLFYHKILEKMPLV